MAYSKQTFSVATVLTATELNQLETNIADHKHGQDNVLGSGITFRTPKDKTAGYTVTTADVGDIITCNGTFTVTLPPLTDFSAGGAVTIANRGTGTITIDGDGAETINGQTTVVVGANQALTVYRDSNAGEWKTFGGGGFSVLESLREADISAVSDVQFTTGIDTHNYVVIDFWFEMSATARVDVELSAGSGFFDTNHNNRFIEMASGGPSQSTTSTGQLTRAIAGTPRKISGRLILHSHLRTGGNAQADVAMINYQTAAHATSGFDHRVGNYWNDASAVLNNAVDGIKLKASTGNLSTGEVIVRGSVV